MFSFNANCQLLKEDSRWVDDIAEDQELDDSAFKICTTNEQIIQYFNDGNGIQYIGDKPAIDSIFYSSYQAIKTNLSGFVRIRFIVNWSGETGRFRVLTSDLNYQANILPSDITKQLLNITKSMNGWQQKTWRDLNVDYYQYLIFKIEKGELTQILP